MTIKILLVDDHKLFREGVRSMLSGQPGLEIVSEAGDGRTALKLVRRHQPDVVLIDIDMPDLNGIDCAHLILEEFPATKVIILSMHSDRQLVIGAVRAGVSGYLLKDCDFEDLTRAIETVTRNQTYLSPKIADTVVRGYMEKLVQLDDSPLGVLTVREREVLQLIAEGKSTKSIAEMLNLSPKTVEYHRRNIMEKLDLHNTAELTRYAIREKLIIL